MIRKNKSFINAGQKISEKGLQTGMRIVGFVLAVVLAAGLIIPAGMGSMFSAADVYAAGKADKKKVLVVCFSATGTTKSAANKIKKAAGGRLHMIEPVDPYTAADLDYSNDECRANAEQKDGDVRPAIKGKVKNIRKYDIIFIGYPIWWGKEPRIIQTFLESYNLKGKKIVPFCTSGGSGISGSMAGIRQAAEGAAVAEGRDLTGVSSRQVKKWVKQILKG